LTRSILPEDVERRSHLYVIVLWLVTGAGALGLFVTVGASGNPYVVALLALVAAFGERGRVHLNADLSESISLVPILFAAVLFGSLAAMIVAIASFIFELGPPYARWASYTASRAITAALTGLVALAISSQISNELVAIAAATLLASLTSQTLDAGFAAVALRLRRRAGMLETLRTLIPVTLSAIPLYAPVVAFLAFAYKDISPFTLPLFLIPALAAQRLYALYRDQRKLTSDLVDANDALERANLSFASALVATLDARDRYTAGHSAAVAIYARDIAAQMGLSPEQQQLVHLCGLVHDIGKVGLPAGLLEKEGRLTVDERREMQRHAEIGEGILANVDTYAEIASIVRHHHERIDGMGYPDALAGAEIPFLARIVSVADAYNAMTSDRPYRDGLPPSVARQRLEQDAETQFDREVVAAFETILADASEDYRVAKFKKPFTFRHESSAPEPAPLTEHVHVGS
jgi:putative nucleotidyltransferase with HDIG domain